MEFAKHLGQLICYLIGVAVVCGWGFIVMEDKNGRLATIFRLTGWTLATAAIAVFIFLIGYLMPFFCD